MQKLMSEGIHICFNKAIVQSIFKHVASGNGPLVLNEIIDSVKNGSSFNF